MRVISINKQTNNRFLNMYEVVFENGVKWTIASRRSAENLTAKTNKTSADTVTIIPMFTDKDGRTKILVTKEFRYPINGDVWAFPAGLVEEGEDPAKAAIRELAEEIGAQELSELTQLTGVCYKSEGMTDETACVYVANITKFGKQNLQDNEDIKLYPIDVEDIPKFISEHKNSMGQTAAVYLPMVYREYMLTKENERLKAQIKKLKEENQKLSGAGQPGEE